MTDTGQITSGAAEFYDEFFVPALFRQWAPQVVAAANLAAGMSVADIACGTGALTIPAAEAVSPGGSAIGVDLNPGMLAVARRKSSEIGWYEAAAESLPFDDDSFDAVLSQFGLMFFGNQKGALSEMWRVLRPGGRLVVAVWGSLRETPGYAGVTNLLSRLFDDTLAELLRSPYSLGDRGTLVELLLGAGVVDPRVVRRPGIACFASVRAWMECDVRGWTLAGRISDVELEQLVFAAESELRGFVREDGSVEFAHPALFAIAEKPGGAAADSMAP